MPTGRIVCPGFVDLHTHYDVQVFWDSTLSPSPLPRGHHRHQRQLWLLGGATRRPASGDYLMHMLVPGRGHAARHARPRPPTGTGRRSAPTSSGSKGGSSPTSASSSGHSAVRRAVMGEAGSERAATDDEVAAMARLLGTSLDEGGLGFSSSWAATHNDDRGDPVPSRFATEDELVALCAEVSRHEGTTLEFIPGVGTLHRSRGVAHGPHVGRRRPTAQLERPDRDGRAGRPGAPSNSRASDHAADLGGRVLGLTMPAPVSPRLSFASGFLLDTIPGWAERHDRAARRAARAARLGRRPSPVDGRRRRSGNAIVRPRQLRPVRADRVPHAGDQATRRAARSPTSRPSEGSIRSTRCARSWWPTTCAPGSPSRRTATRNGTGRPGSTCGATTAPSSAPPTPVPTSTSSPRSTTRR